MGYDERLAERITAQIGGDADVTEKKMFGGVAYMFQGNMAVGVHENGLMVRLPPEEHESALAEPGVHHFDMTGRPMKGWVVVDGGSVAEDDDLRYWLDRGMRYAGSLPPK